MAISVSDEPINNFNEPPTLYNKNSFKLDLLNDEYMEDFNQDFRADNMQLFEDELSELEGQRGRKDLSLDHLGCQASETSNVQQEVDSLMAECKHNFVSEITKLS